MAIVIAIFTIWLTKASCKLASIAERQENMTRATERAYVFAKVELIEPIIPTHEGTAITKNRVLFPNHGKTPATITYMSGAPYITVVPPQQLLTASHTSPELPDGLIIASENGYNLPIPLKITNQQMGEIERGERRLFCAGLIKYKDIFQMERETGFCWEYIHTQGRFKFCDASRLNYYT